MLAHFAEAMASNEEVATNPAQSPAESPMEVQQTEPVEVNLKVDPFDVDRCPWTLLGMAARPLEHLGNCLFASSFCNPCVCFISFPLNASHACSPLMLYDAQRYCSES